MKRLLLLVLFCVTYLSTQACSCVGITNFCETITYDTGEIWEEQIIVRGKKIESEPGGMRLEVIDLIYGQLNESVIFVDDGNGADCGEHTSVFETGKEYLISLTPGFRSAISYRVSICGTTFLPIENDIIVGPLTPSINSLPYDQLSTLSGCGNLRPTPIRFSIGPNPTQGIIRLFGSTFSPTDIHLTFYDVAGRKVAIYGIENEDRDFDEQLNLQQLAGGMYLVEIRMNSTTRLEKIIVAN